MRFLTRITYLRNAGSGDPAYRHRTNDFVGRVPSRGGGSPRPSESEISRPQLRWARGFAEPARTLRSCSADLLLLWLCPWLVTVAVSAPLEVEVAVNWYGVWTPD